MNRVEGGGIFFWGPILAIPMWIAIFYICALCSGCTTCLPTRYSVKVPIFVTQDAMHRLPYSDMNRMGSEGQDE